MAGCLILLLLAAPAWWRWLKPAASNPPVEALWRPFLSGDRVIVIYSNAVFVRDADNGFRVARPDEAASLDKESQDYNGPLFTGTGAVMAVRELTQLFDAHRASFVLKRSLLLNWDDARQSNLIFIGSRLQNPALSMLPSFNDFSVLENDRYASFINLHPRPGELSAYSRPVDSFATDYAVLALLPGLQPGKWILSFSGLSTLGTEAAVEFASTPEGAAALLGKPWSEKHQVLPFEALLETTIVGGVPIQTRLITIHRH